MKESETMTNQNIQQAGYVPEVDPSYVRYGNFNEVKQIIDSRIFFPVWITGLSGNGKTQMVEQACARNKDSREDGREFVRVNFTLETDENDLLGGLRLVEKNGVTVSEFQEGPVVKALRTGAILLLDEIDVGHTNKIMCLQSLLEGKGVLLKTTGEWVKPAPGFNVFATSNTKGRGSEDGKFIGTQIMNNAFLDRFAAMIEQKYPDQHTEELILQNYFIDIMWISKGITHENIPGAEAADGANFIKKLCEWANQIRAAYDNQASDGEVVTTRTLINILRAFSIFGDKEKAIKYACERYPDVARDNFIEIFRKQQDEPLEKTRTQPDSEDEAFMDFKKQSF